MQLFKALSLLATAAVAVAQNRLTFISQDEINRTIYFTPSAEYAYVAPVPVKGKARVTVNIPQGWVGNYYAISEGRPNEAGMLGEVTFQGWNGLTYFDVSAIVRPWDHVGVKMMYPAVATKPDSGCDVFPCDNVYMNPEDKQTKTTPETHIVTTLGTRSDSGSGWTPASVSGSDSDSDSDSGSDSDGEWKKKRSVVAAGTRLARAAALGQLPQN